MGGKKSFDDYGIDTEGVLDGEMKAKCPQCADERKKYWLKTLSVNVSEGVWFCHHCGWSGSLGGKFTKAQIRKIIKPSWLPGTTADMPPKVLTWLVMERKISSDALSANHITARKAWMSPEHPDVMTIQFPYYKDGEVVNVKYRSGDKLFRQEKNAEKCLYRYDDIVHYNGDDPLVICEGEFDALTFCEAGIQTATSVPDGAPDESAKKFKTKFDFLKSAGPILEKYKQVVLCVDTDGPGKLLEQELVRRIGPEQCLKAQMPKDCKDANDVLRKHGVAAVRRLMTEAKPYPVSGIISAESVRSELESMYDNGLERGASTGWSCVDPYFTVKVGEMTIVTGIPGSGKSNFLDAMAINLAQSQGWTFAVFSPENWPVQRHISTLLEKYIGKPFRDRKNFPRMSKDEMYTGLKWVNENFHFIIPREESMSVETILKKARATVLRHGVRGVIIDPWNEIEHDVKAGEREDQYISRSLSSIRRFARFNGVHVFVVAHPRTLIKDKDTGKYKPPTMYEISGGANWRNKADNGICVHRPEVNSPAVEIHVQKIRFREVGRLGTARLNFCADTSGYTEPTPGIVPGINESPF